MGCKSTTITTTITTTTTTTITTTTITTTRIWKLLRFANNRMNRLPNVKINWTSVNTTTLTLADAITLTISYPTCKKPPEILPLDQSVLPLSVVQQQLHLPLSLE